jgi:hypothetical protein
MPFNLKISLVWTVILISIIFFYKFYKIDNITSYDFLVIYNCIFSITFILGYVSGLKDNRNSSFKVFTELSFSSDPIIKRMQFSYAIPSFLSNVLVLISLANKNFADYCLLLLFLLFVYQVFISWYIRSKLKNK